MAFPWGKILILIGILMFGGEFALPGYFMGAVGVAFIVCGLLLDLGIQSPEFIAIATVFSGAISVLIFYWIGQRMKRRKIASGGEALIGETAIVMKPFEGGRGLVKVKGEEWSAKVRDLKQTIKKGDRVKVVGFEGVHLMVEKAG